MKYNILFIILFLKGNKHYATGRKSKIFFKKLPF